MPEKNKITVNQKTVISPNLLPVEAREELYYQTIGDTINKVLLILTGMVILLWVIGGILLWRISQEKSNITQNLVNNVDANKIQELNKMNEQFKELRTLNAKVDKSVQKEYRFSEVLGELSKITPQGVVLISFETVMDPPGWVKIKGAAQNRDVFLHLKKGLEDSQFYDKVDSPLSNYVSPESVNFELNAQLKGWKPSWAADLKKKAVNQASSNTNSD